MKPISDVREMSPNQLVSWFMIASYAYYVLGEPLMSDAAFDLLVMRLKENWDTADHYHKALIKETHWFRTSQEHKTNNVFQYKDTPSWHTSEK